MDDKEFKGYVVDALKQIIERQDKTDVRLEQIDGRLTMLQNEQKEMKNDIKRIDKKTDDILKYVEHLDIDLQKHKLAEIIR